MLQTHMLRTIPLNQDWKFCYKGDDYSDETSPTPYEINYDDTTWRTLNLPHDWSIEFDFNIEDSIVGSEAGYLDGGVGWYRKALILPKTLANKRIAIRFGGVYMDSTVYVNDKKVGRYPNGYMPFTYDLTSFVIADGVTENTIAIKVVNKQPSSRWYSGSGIYRDVALIVTHPIHIVEYGTFVTTPFIQDEYPLGCGTVCVETEIKNTLHTKKNIIVRHILTDYQGNSVPIDRATPMDVMLLPNEVKKVKQTLQVLHPQLWSTSNPHLYKLHTELLLDDVVIDQYETRWGFRWLTFDAKKGFFLNGQWMKLKGVCMHHDQGALGAVASPRAQERQMEIMQAMGVNAIRVAHNPASDKLLEICDEKGLLVIDEAFDTWYGGKKQYDLGRFFDKSSSSHPDGSETVSWAEFDLKNMVKRGRNFPCIIKWSVGNEVGEACGDLRSLETIKKMKQWVLEVDPTRGITQGADKFRFDNGEGGHEAVAEVQDTVGFNYAEKNYDTLHQKHPHWVLYGSETSSATKSRGIYSHPDTIGSHDADAHKDYQQSSYDNDHVAWGATASQAWIADRDRQFILGQFVWTGFDYIGEPTPWHNTGGRGHALSPKSSYFGIVDTAGFPKDDYFLYQSIWRSVEHYPMVHILPHWNWEDVGLRKKVAGDDGKIPLRIYSNTPHIELFIDGISYGKKSFAQKETVYGFKYQQQSETSQKLYLEWRLDYTYRPGTTIEAIGLNNDGEKIAYDRIVTSHQPHGIKLHADREAILADGIDLSYITVTIVDHTNNFVPTATNEVTFEIVGDGHIVGVDNGNPISHERYKAQKDGSWKRKAFNGKALVIVQSTPTGGSFTLTAKAEGLISSTLTLNTLPCKNTTTSYLLTTNTSSCATPHNKDIVALSPVHIIGERGKAPVLPSQIKARLANGDSSFVKVIWDDIDENDFNKNQVFDVKGTVENKEIQVIAKVTIRSIVAVQAIHSATLPLVPPLLPPQVMVYYSDGEQQEKSVEWHKPIDSFVHLKDTYLIQGTIKGTNYPVEASIRIAKTPEQTKQTSNYAKQWTGSQFPAAIASFTSDDTQTPYTITAINDTIIDFTMEKSNLWSNYQSHSRTGDWVGILFAEGGKLTTRYIDTLKVGFYKDDQIGAPEDFTIEYYTPDTLPPLPSDFGHILSGDLANDNHWKPVENLLQSTHLVKEGCMQSFDFKTVSTYALRLNMKNQKHLKGIGITEIEAYGKEPLYFDHYQLNGIFIDDENVLNQFDNHHTLSYSKKSTHFPQIKVEATHHARVTIIPQVNQHKIILKITPENGDISQLKVYTIYLN